MKWKITRCFLLAILISLLVSVIIFTGASLFPMINWGEKRPKKTYDLWALPGTYTLDFAEYIGWQDNQVVLKEQGIRELKEHQLWIQVLNGDGEEIYSCFKPQGVPTHYSPGRLVHYHSNSGRLMNSSLFAGLIERGQQELCYLIGFPADRLDKISFVYDPQMVVIDILKKIIRAITISLIIGCIIAYLFSLRLVNPILKVIATIDEFTQGDYSRKEYKSRLFQEVFKNLNRLADRLQLNQEERKKTEQIREEWIANISHDVKTPLSSIRGYAEILCDRDCELSKEERIKYSKIIMDKANYITDLTEDLNLTYQLQNNLLPLKKKEENLVDIVRESIITIINNRDDLRTRIHFNPEQEVFNLKCNARLLQRAFINIIYNAIIHNQIDTIVTVRLGRFKDCSGLGVEIKDNGQGIAEKDLDKLFDRYYRGTSTEQGDQGSGLGLAIAKQTIQFHDGSIEVESEPGVGTRVIICFK